MATATVQQIIDAVVARVATVKPPTYATSLQHKRDALNRRTPLGDREDLGLWIMPGPKAIPELGEFGIKRRELPIDVLVIVQGKTADADAVQAVNDIEAAFRADQRLGGLARFCSYEFSEAPLEQGRSHIAGQQITITVTFNET